MERHPQPRPHLRFPAGCHLRLETRPLDEPAALFHRRQHRRPQQLRRLQSRPHRQPRRAQLQRRGQHSPAPRVFRRRRYRAQQRPRRARARRHLGHRHRVHAHRRENPVVERLQLRGHRRRRHLLGRFPPHQPRTPSRRLRQHHPVRGARRRLGAPQLH